MRLKSAVAAVAMGAAAVLGFAGPAHAQQARAIPIQVQPGQTFLLDMNYNIEDSTGIGSIAMDIGVGLEIEEMGPQGGVWRWSLESISIDPSVAATGPDGVNPFAGVPFGPGMDQALSATLRLMTDLDIVCRVNAQGACVEVLNWPQWRERAENTILIGTGVLRVLEDQQQQSQSDEVLLGPVVSPEYKPEYVPSTRRGAASPPMVSVGPAPVESYSASPIPYALIADAVEAVAGILLDSVDGRMLASMSNLPAITDIQGVTLAQGQSLQTETRIALPFGAEPVRMTGTVTLDGIDRSAGVARFSRSASLDSAGFTQSLTTMMQNGAPPIINALAPILPADYMGEDPVASANFMVSMIGAGLASLNLSMQETSTGEVDLATGLVRSGEIRQTISARLPDGASAMEQVTTVTFTLRPAPLNQPRLGAAAAQ